MGKEMRNIGIVTLLSVIATAAAPNSKAHAATPFVTAKSAERFAECFAARQDLRSAAWWFVPRQGGGTFSNVGAQSADKPYFVVINGRGLRREIQVQDAAGAPSTLREVNQCL
jgi:hypothetical protein